MIDRYLHIIQESITFSKDIKLVYKIISKFTDEEKQKFTGPRYLYDSSEFRKIKMVDNIPVAFLEGKIFDNTAKINIGVDPKYRNKNHMKNLFESSVDELSKRGINKIVAAVSKQNDKSNNLMKKLGFNKIKRKNVEKYKFHNHFNVNYYERNL